MLSSQHIYIYIYIYIYIFVSVIVFSQITFNIYINLLFFLENILIISKYFFIFNKNLIRPTTR